jgi:hypothetical protein
LTALSPANQLGLGIRHTATGELLGNLRPLGSNLAVQTFDCLFLVESEWRLVEDGVDMIVPSLSALLTGAASETRRNDDPFLGAKLIY